MPYEVEHQVANDIPSYIVKDKQGQSWILHHNQLLLIALKKKGAFHHVQVYVPHGQDVPVLP